MLTLAFDRELAPLFAVVFMEAFIVLLMVVLMVLLRLIVEALMLSSILALTPVLVLSFLPLSSPWPLPASVLLAVKEEEEGGEEEKEVGEDRDTGGEAFVFSAASWSRMSISGLISRFKHLTRNSRLMAGE